MKLRNGYKCPPHWFPIDRRPRGVGVEGPRGFAVWHPIALEPLRCERCGLTHDQATTADLERELAEAGWATFRKIPSATLIVDDDLGEGFVVPPGRLLARSVLSVEFRGGRP